MSKWISVKDRLPSTNKPVWIFWRDRQVLIGWYTLHGKEREEAIANGDQSYNWWSTEDDKCRWTNWWMPIEPKPEPPFRTSIEHVSIAQGCRSIKEDKWHERCKCSTEMQCSEHKEQ